MRLQPNQASHQGEHLLCCADGTEKPILKTVSRIELEGAPHYLEAFIDISEKKRLEEQLQRSQKMEAIGTLAGGVAHDLNNILSGLINYPELILMDVDEADPLRKPLETVKQSGEKAAVIVQDLLTLAQQNTAIKQTVNLTDVVDEFMTSPEYQRIINRHRHISVTVRSSDDIRPIDGSPVHLSKVVMNLILNAAEAIINQGHVQLELENRYLDSPRQGYETVEEGDYVVLTIADDGMGISPQDIGRIFEPFYSRKKLGKSGSGLGMAVVWSTVKEHKGYIEVDSHEGEGTTFSVFFPVSTKSYRAETVEPEREIPYGNGQSILVVDDIEAQREIATSMLSHLNYNVRTVMDGESAVELLSHQDFDLVLLDMIMEPGMDGLETYTRIIESKPDQDVILVSGYSDPERVIAMKQLGLTTYIKKPYSIHVLAVNIHNVLSD